MVRCIALISILFFSTALIAQVSLSGEVTFQGEGVPGATIQLKELGKGTITDPNGVFMLEDLTEGQYTLLIRSMGYSPQSHSITLTSENRHLSFSLEQNELGLDAVVITGTMQPTMVSASPIKVDVISSKHLNTFIPSASSSIMEGIKLVNGVQEVVACGVCFTNSISINGLPGPYTAVLMDGSPIYGNLAAVYGLNGIPNMIIDRFEVIKGPNSTLYGSEAMAGVINIITKDPEDQPALSIDVMGTTNLEAFGNIGVSTQTKSFSGFTGLNYAVIKGFEDRNNDNFGDLINLDRYSLFTKWSMKRPSQKKFTLAAKLFYEDRRNGVEAYLRDRNYQEIRGNDSIYGESIYTYRAEVFGTYEFQTTEDIKIDYSFSRHFQDSFYGADYYEARQDIGFMNLIWQRNLDKHQLLTGFTNRIQLYDDNTTATRTMRGGQLENDPANQWIPGVFIQDEFEVTKNLTFLGGVRLDHYQAHGFIFSPRLATKFKPETWTTIRLNFGSGFKIVNLFAEDHAFVTGQRDVIISETLNPERSINGSFNFNHVFTIGASQGMIDLDAYYSYFTNKIIPDYSTPGQIIYSNGSGNAISKGIGLSWNQEFSFPLSTNAGFNLQSVTASEFTIKGKETRRMVEFAPRWSGIFNANYNWRKIGLTLAYSMNITGPMALPEVYDLDQSGDLKSYSRPQESAPFSIHNLQVSKQLTNNFSMYGGVQNIFDYLQEASPLVGYNDPNSATGFSSYFDTSYAYSPIHGREIYLGVKWNLP